MRLVGTNEESVYARLRVATDQPITEVGKQFVEAAQRRAVIVVALPDVVWVVGDFELDWRRELAVVFDDEQLRLDAAAKQILHEIIVVTVKIERNHIEVAGFQKTRSF